MPVLMQSVLHPVAATSCRVISNPKSLNSECVNDSIIKVIESRNGLARMITIDATAHRQPPYNFERVLAVEDRKQ